MRLVTGVLGRLFVAMSFISVYPWGIELFPNIILSQGLGFCNAMARLGSVVSPWVMITMKKVHHIAPWMSLGIFLTLVTMLIAHLPETQRSPTVPKIDDLKDFSKAETKTAFDIECM